MSGDRAGQPPTHVSIDQTGVGLERVYIRRDVTYWFVVLAMRRRLLLLLLQ